ncbi:hypothetical protein ACWNT8_06710 [Pigmentibacter ruber]
MRFFINAWNSSYFTLPLAPLSPSFPLHPVNAMLAIPKPSALSFKVF